MPEVNSHLVRKRRTRRRQGKQKKRKKAQAEKGKGRKGKKQHGGPLCMNCAAAEQNFSSHSASEKAARPFYSLVLASKSLV